MIVDHAQDAHATAQELWGGGCCVCENGGYLVVVQTSFFQEWEEGYVIRHLHRENITGFEYCSKDSGDDLKQTVVVQPQRGETGGQSRHVRQARVRTRQQCQRSAGPQVERQTCDGVVVE